VGVSPLLVSASHYQLLMMNCSPSGMQRWGEFTESRRIVNIQVHHGKIANNMTYEIAHIHFMLYIYIYGCSEIWDLKQLWSVCTLCLQIICYNWFNLFIYHFSLNFLHIHVMPKHFKRKGFGFKALCMKLNFSLTSTLHFQRLAIFTIIWRTEQFFPPSLPEQGWHGTNKCLT